MKKYHVNVFRFFVVLLALHYFAAEVCAQWSTDPTVNDVVCSAAEIQGGSLIVSDGNGGAIIAWMDNRNASSFSMDIYAQRIDRNGVVKWIADGIGVCTDPGYQSNHRIIVDGFGGAIIMWQDNRGAHPKIYAQRIDSNGIAQWTVNGISLGSDPSVDQSEVQLISDGSGGAIAVWQNTLLPNSNICVQRINADGVFLWDTSGASVGTGQAGSMPQITSDGAGGAIVCWQEYVDTARGHDIYTQRIDSSGEIRWGNSGQVICSARLNQQQPQIISDDSGGAIIAWLDPRGSPGTSIYAQRIDSSGTIKWIMDGVLINTDAVGLEGQRLLSDKNSGVYVTWKNGISAVCAQRVNASGVLQWATDVISIGEGVTPQIATDGGRGAVVTFSRSGGSYGTDIYAQKINLNGDKLWSTNGNVISRASSEQLEPQIAENGSGGTIITWMDGRNIAISSYDIYAQQVNDDGTLGGTTGVGGDENILPRSAELKQNYPNPFNPTTTISFHLSVKSFVSLKIYDLLGRVVSTLVSEELPEGMYARLWNAGHLASGIYISRLEAGNYAEGRKIVLLK